jgi:hypothetical protein
MVKNGVWGGRGHHLHIDPPTPLSPLPLAVDCSPACKCMQVLLKLDLGETREFFSAFFSLSDFHWHGFLSSRLSFIQLIGFGLSLFVESSNVARVNLLQKGLPGLLVMLARLAQTFK